MEVMTQGAKVMLTLFCQEISESKENEEINTSIFSRPKITVEANIPAEINTYQLPPCLNWGILPKRYDPNFEAQRSRYPLANVSLEKLSPNAKAYRSSLYSKNILTSVKEALKVAKWKKTMEDEISALKKNGTWEKCILPPKKGPVRGKWVFIVEYKVDGTI